MNLLNWVLRKFDTVKVAKSNEPLENLKVWLGKKHTVEAVVENDIYLTIPKRKKSTIKAFIEYNGPIKAPINKGDKLGKLTVFINDELRVEEDLISNEDISSSNIFSRLFRSLNYLVWGDV